MTLATNRTPGDTNRGSAAHHVPGSTVRPQLTLLDGYVKDSTLVPDETQDVVQEAFVRAFRALVSLKDRERFAALLFTIARNRARSYLTSRATHTKAAEEATRESQLLEDCVPAASHALEKEAELRAVREVIDGLREGPEKETVRLFYLEGTLSAREIAMRMGVGKSAVTM